MSFKLCIIGASPKGDELRKNWTDWKIKYQKELSKIDDLEILFGDQWLDETRPFITFGHDSDMIKKCDAVVANAENKVGAGTAQEILIAKYFSKPVVVILPKNSHHRRSDVVFNGELVQDWIHPFIYSTADYIAENLEAAVEWIKSYQLNPAAKKIKDILIIDQAIAEYNKVK